MKCTDGMESTEPELLKSITEHPDVQRLIIQLIKLKAENKRLKKALRRYGHHDDPCNALEGECICGFEQILKQKGG